MKNSRSIFFNAMHAPVGAFATFTLGYRGPSGGLGLELGGPAGENIFVGVEKSLGLGYEALPFFANSADASRRYDVAAGEAVPPGLVASFPDARIHREFSLGSDTWLAGDLTFSIYSAPKEVPDPAKAGKNELRRALVPAIFAELTVDNRQGKRNRKVFFGYEGSNPACNMRRLDDVSRGQFSGIGQGPLTAIVSDSPGVTSGCGFTLDQCLEPDFVENLAFGLGGTGVLMATVPKGKKAVLRFAICFYRDGMVTSGLPTRYFYTDLFASIEEVAGYALRHFDEQKSLALEADDLVRKSSLTDDQQFHLCQSVRSYFGSTEFLRTQDGTPFWSVNEGEYRMLNTFDLSVDHLFFEIDRNPWVVRNQLDWYVRRYSYTDHVRLPGDDTEYPGGIGFAHDMGIGNCLSRPGHSSYEKFGLSGCFSHMTHEQVVNWVCCATTYVLKTGDSAWSKSNATTFRACLRSLVNRDHPDPRKRDGVMSCDSSRCLGGSEITTYDSLDASLGQARNNLYLAVKTWAAYVGLARILGEAGFAKETAVASKQASLCAATIISRQSAEGFIPAILGEGNAARIIPAIEGLVFPLVWGMESLVRPGGEFAHLRQALEKHLRAILVHGICKFPDGSWKLSSSNENSWLSKIYLCQHIARELLGLDQDPVADRAHLAWLLDEENARFAFSDQMVSGKAKGSKYYPRGVTSWLWISSTAHKKRRTPSKRRTAASPKTTAR
jgi:hypothetical protein